MKIALWNLVLHDDCIWNSINNGSCDALEEVNVLGLVKARVPCVSLAILSALDNEHYLIGLHNQYG